MYGGTRKFQEDPNWRDLILFYEYFHGDNGAGLGASHQTGWTGIVARGMHLFATSTAEQFLELGKAAAVVEVEPAPSGATGGAAVAAAADSAEALQLELEAAHDTRVRQLTTRVESRSLVHRAALPARLRRQTLREVARSRSATPAARSFWRES